MKTFSKNDEYIILFVWGTLKLEECNHKYLIDAGARKLTDSIYFKPMKMHGEVYEVRKDKIKNTDVFEEVCGYGRLFDPETKFHYYKSILSRNHHTNYTTYKDAPEHYGYIQMYKKGDRVIVTNTNDTQDKDYIGMVGTVIDYFSIEWPPSSINDFGIGIDFGDHVTFFSENELDFKAIASIEQKLITHKESIIEKEGWIKRFIGRL